MNANRVPLRIWIRRRDWIRLLGAGDGHNRRVMNGQMTPTHLVNQLKSGLVLLALVHQFDVHRGEGRGGGGQDDRGRGGDGGSLCAREMCVHAARSTARVDDHTSRLASRTVRRRRRRESEFEFESDGCGRTPAIRSIDRSAIAGFLNSTNGGRRDARWRDARASIASV